MERIKMSIRVDAVLQRGDMDLDGRPFALLSSTWLNKAAVIRA